MLASTATAGVLRIETSVQGYMVVFDAVYIHNMEVLLSEHNGIAESQWKLLYSKRFGHEFFHDTIWTQRKRWHQQ